MTSRPAAGSDLCLEFRAIHEPEPGKRLRTVFNEYWPGYHLWMCKHPGGWPALDECRSRLRAHMPELFPVYESILDLVGHDHDRARFLTLWSPTPIIRACSQAVISTDTGPVLIRNYDHAPHLCDAIMLSTQWGGVRTHVMTDCVWGALDGVNDAGLTVALAFGGRRAVGPGFSASLVLRYLLQTCTSVREACDTLRRVPVYMSYNFTMLDRSGAHLTAFASPDRPLSLDLSPVSTNHQQHIEWPQYAEFTQSAERRACLSEIVESTATVEQAIDAFLAPPLVRSQYRRASGTLYTVAYSPNELAMTLYWRGRSERISPEDPRGQSITVHY